MNGLSSAKKPSFQPAQSNSGGIGYSLEVFPPRELDKQLHHWQAVAAFCQLNPSFISVTCGAFGQGSTLTEEVALRIQSMGVEPAIHFTCLGKTATEVRKIALRYKQNQFKYIIALRGDYPMNSSPEFLDELKARKDGFLYAQQLIEVLNDTGDFDITVAAYPEGHPEAKSLDEDIGFLKAKFNAGADRAITQFFFDPEVFLRFRDKATKLGIDKPIIPGILPILNIDKVVRFATKCKVDVPPFLVRMYEGVPRQSSDHKILAMNILSHQITRLISEGVDFFHFYTINEIPLNTHICRWLKAGF